MGRIIQQLEVGDKRAVQQDEVLQHAIRHAQVTKPQGVEYKQKVLDCQEFLRSGDSYELCLTDQTEIRLPAVKYVIATLYLSSYIWKTLIGKIYSGKPPSRWSVYKRLRQSTFNFVSLGTRLIFTD